MARLEVTLVSVRALEAGEDAPDGNAEWNLGNLVVVGHAAGGEERKSGRFVRDDVVDGGVYASGATFTFDNFDPLRDTITLHSSGFEDDSRETSFVGGVPGGVAGVGGVPGGVAGVGGVPGGVAGVGGVPGGVAGPGGVQLRGGGLLPFTIATLDPAGQPLPNLGVEVTGTGSPYVTSYVTTWRIVVDGPAASRPAPAGTDARLDVTFQGVQIVESGDDGTDNDAEWRLDYLAAVEHRGPRGEPLDRESLGDSLADPEAFDFKSISVGRQFGFDHFNPHADAVVLSTSGVEDDSPLGTDSLPSGQVAVLTQGAALSGLRVQLGGNFGLDPTLLQRLDFVPKDPSYHTLWQISTTEPPVARRAPTPVQPQSSLLTPESTDLITFDNRDGSSAEFPF